METFKNIGTNTIAFYGLDVLGVNNMLREDPNIVTRNLKRGFLLYLANETSALLLDRNSSNFIRMDLREAVDDTAFLAMGTLGLEIFEIPTRIGTIIPKIGDPAVNNALINSVILEGLNITGDMLEGSQLSVLRHPSYLVA
jgi:hypothetical protein